MSIATTTGGATPAIPDDDDLTGLEDIDARDLVMPRINLDHQTGEFVDSLSGERNTEIEVVILGLIKQRVLWAPEVEEGAVPLCKSWDAKIGRPGKDFPWDAAGFDQASAGVDANGELALPCEACALKEWGSNPKSETPWCAEQHTFPVLTDGGPALLTFQRSSLKASRAYLSSFARKGEPLYTVHTTIKLTQNKRGTVKYAVPSFIKGAPTEPEQWGEFAAQYRSIRDFVRTPRTKDEEGEPASAKPTAPATAAASTDEDDDLPF